MNDSESFFPQFYFTVIRLTLMLLAVKTLAIPSLRFWNRRLIVPLLPSPSDHCPALKCASCGAGGDRNGSALWCISVARACSCIHHQGGAHAPFWNECIYASHDISFSHHIVANCVQLQSLVRGRVSPQRLVYAGFLDVPGDVADDAGAPSNRIYWSSIPSLRSALVLLHNRLREHHAKPKSRGLSSRLL